MLLKIVHLILSMIAGFFVGFILGELWKWARRRDE